MDLRAPTRRALACVIIIAGCGPAVPRVPFGGLGQSDAETDASKEPPTGESAPPSATAWSSTGGDGSSGEGEDEGDGDDPDSGTTFVEGSSSSGPAGDTGSSSTGASPACGDSPGMICVPAGDFVRGSDDASLPADEHPQAVVSLSEFEIDEAEVTVEEYVDCMHDGDCSTPHDDHGDGTECNVDHVGAEDHPINCVDWFQAAEYCAWAGKQLPTEAQWEKAARGTEGQTYPWDGEVADCSLAVMREGDFGCGTGTPAMPVGSRSPAGDSPYGLKDAGGNLWEWTDDWYDAGYYAVAPSDDPMGPDNGVQRVVRGGGWVNDTSTVSNGLRVADRAGTSPGLGSTAMGIRCARSF